MKKLQVWWPVLFAVTLIVGMWMGFSLRKNIPDGQGFFGTPKKASVQEVIDLLQKKYVDSVHTDSLTEEAIQSMLGHLDPHTVYIPAVYTEAANEDLNGNFEGIGIEYYVINDTVNAVNVLEKGPSAQAGVKMGDKIIKVGDSVVAGVKITNERIRKLLRGPAGSEVEVKLLRNGQPLDVKIKRGTIPKFSVDAAYMISENTGFIHLNKFSRTAYEEFMAALEDLQKKGMKKLIFDIRGNGGGILEEAVDIVDEFLDQDKLILYTEGLHAKRQEYHCKRPGLFEKGALVLLIDEFSASASEVLAGALQDWDRATIIGRRSFGKGLVQEPFELSDGSQLRLTVSKYYTPSGRNIQKPFDKSKEAYQEEVYDRFHNGQAVVGDTAVHTGKVFKTIIKKRVVYGGGGITPDVFVAIDTISYSNAARPLLYYKELGKFVYQQYFKHPETYNQYKSAADFEKGFSITSAILDAWAAEAGAGIDSIKSLTNADREALNRRYKSFMSQQIWQMNGYYQFANTIDKTVLKGLETIKTLQ